MHKKGKIALIIILIVAGTVGFLELQRYRGRQAAIEKIKKISVSASQEQKKSLIHQASREYGKSLSMFSFSESKAHNDFLCNALDAYIAGAAESCGNGNQEACGSLKILVATHQELDCGYDHARPGQPGTDDWIQIEEDNWVP